MSRECYVFAGGGTGGHLYPGLAVAAAVRKSRPGSQVIFLTTTRALDRHLLEKTNYGQIEQTVLPFTLNPLRIPRFLLRWFAQVRAVTEVLKDLRPRAVLGLGGYAAGPAVVAAHKLGLKAAILNPDAIPGRANRFLARRVRLVIPQWEVSVRYFPSHSPLAVWGCPIRPEFAAPVEQAAARAHFGLEPDRPVVLVTGASQGARSVNRVMRLIWPEFSHSYPEWQLLHLTGQADEAETSEGYRQAGSLAFVLAFTHEMWLAVAASDIVVSRAGASTLAELTAIGRSSILLPYPYHRDRHQHANARVLVEAGAAFLIEDRLEPELNRMPVAAALAKLADPAVRASMTRAALTLRKADAAERVAEWMAREESA